MLEYTKGLLHKVQKLHYRVFRAQENISNLLKSIYTWAMLPVLIRKDQKNENLLSINDREEKFSKRYNEIETVAGEVTEKLNENYKLFFDLLLESEYDKSEFDGEFWRIKILFKYMNMNNVVTETDDDVQKKEGEEGDRETAEDGAVNIKYE